MLQKTKATSGADEKTPSIPQYFSWINNTDEGGCEEQTLINLEYFKWLHDEYGIGWYAYQLMIGDDMWSRVHGIVYPDGTVRDPAIVAAIFGFFRNRTETAIRSDVNQEDYVWRTEVLAQRVTKAVRWNKGMPKDEAKAAVLEVAEYAANLLEGGELVPMTYPPTAKIESMRKRTDCDVQEALDYMEELVETLKKACHIQNAE